MSHRPKLPAFLGRLVAIAVLAACAAAFAGDPPAGAGEPRKAPKEASAGGKYSRLLRVIDVPEDLKTYGEVNDWGFWSGTEWAGHRDLPAGYWVYVAPSWYIWGDCATCAEPALSPAPRPEPGSKSAPPLR